MRKASIAAALISACFAMQSLALAAGGGGGGGGGGAGGGAGSSAAGSVGGAGAPGSAGAPSPGLGGAPGPAASPGSVGQVASPNNVVGQPGTTQPSSGTTGVAGTPSVASGSAAQDQVQVSEGHPGRRRPPDQRDKSPVRTTWWVNQELRSRHRAPQGQPGRQVLPQAVRLGWLPATATLPLGRQEPDQLGPPELLMVWRQGCKAPTQ